MMIKIMWLISMKLVVVITLLSVLFGCCGHGGVFASKRAGSSSSHTNSERLITLINGRRPSHPTNLGGHHEGAAGHVNTRRRTAKSVPETNLDTIPASHSSPNEGGHHLTPPNLIINRHHEGDIFATTDCLSASFCTNGDGEDVGSTGSNLNSRHAGKLRPTSAENCECQCNNGHPTFREDERKCVNDLPECPLAEFVTSPSDQEKIPFVFLPLASGQAVYPSARIKLSNGDHSDLASSSSYISENIKTASPGDETNVNKDDNEEPICVVSSTDLMYRDGWNNLEKIYNSFSSSQLHPTGSDTKSKTSENFYHHPLRLVQQPNAKTALQWLGDDKLRRILEGKLVLIHLVCKKASNGSNASTSSYGGKPSAKDASAPKRQIFRPCVALRIAGSPGSAESIRHDLSRPSLGGAGSHPLLHPYPYNTGRNGNNDNNTNNNKLGLSDYIAIGVCVGFLGLVYVVAISIFLMLRNKRKRKQRMRQQFLLPPSSMPSGLGFKSSRILGLEEAFIPELRRIEPIPNMSEANLARLQRRRQAQEEERNARMKASMEDGQFQHHQRGYNRQPLNQQNIVSSQLHKLTNNELNRGVVEIPSRVVDHHLQQGLSRGQPPQYEQDHDTVSMLQKNNKLFEAHRKYTDRMKQPTQDAHNISSSVHNSQQQQQQKSKFLSSQSSSADSRHQGVTKTVSNSSASTIDKMYVNPGFHLSYSPNGDINDNSSKNYSRNNELPSDVEICEVNDEDMDLDSRSDNYERLRKYQIKNDDASGDVSLVGDLPPIRQLNESRKNKLNTNFPYPGSKQISSTQKLQSDTDNMFDENGDFKLSTTSNYRQTSTSTSNSSDHGNRQREAGDIAILRGGVARNNHHGDFSKTSKMSNRHSTSTASSNNSREASDPMSLDSGVITTLSRSVSPMSSSNPGSTASQHSRGRRENLLSEKSNGIEEETNVDGSDNNAGLDDEDDDDDDDQDVVDVADTSTDDSSSIGNGSTGEINSTTRSVGSTYYKGGRVTGSLILQNSQKNDDSRKSNGISSNQFVPNSRKITNDNAAISGTPSIIGRNGKQDALTKLYDNAVLKIPKVIPSDSDSLYSECNNYNNKSNNGKGFVHALNSLDSKKHRLLLMNNVNPSTKHGSNKMNKRQRRKMGNGTNDISHDAKNDTNVDATANESSFDTDDHDNSYESIKCDGNLTNDEAVDTAADSEPGGDGTSEISHRSLYVNKYMSNSLNTNTKSIPELDEEEFDEEAIFQPSSKVQHAFSSSKQKESHETKVNPYSKSISSMDKMIVKIGGSANGDNPHDASVYSGRLLIEVAGNDEYVKRNGNAKSNRKQSGGQNEDDNESTRNSRNHESRNFRINGTTYDPDTLDRGCMSSSDFPDDSLERPNKNKRVSNDKVPKANAKLSNSMNSSDNVTNGFYTSSSFNVINCQSNNGFASSPAPPSDVDSCSTITTNTGGNNTDYSFRLFENGQLLTSTDVDDPSYVDQKHAFYDGDSNHHQSGGPTSLPSLPPALPPKKSKSQTSLVQHNLYENEEEDYNENTNSHFSDTRENDLNSKDDSFDSEAAAVKRQTGLAAERKKYFERLNGGQDFGVTVNSNQPRKLWESNCV